MKTWTPRNAKGQFESFHKIIKGANSVGMDKGFEKGLKVASQLASKPTPHGAGAVLAVGAIIGAGIVWGGSKLFGKIR